MPTDSLGPLPEEPGSPAGHVLAYRIALTPNRSARQVHRARPFHAWERCEDGSATLERRVRMDDALKSSKPSDSPTAFSMDQIIRSEALLMQNLDQGSIDLLGCSRRKKRSIILSQFRKDDPWSLFLRICNLVKDAVFSRVKSTVGQTKQPIRSSWRPGEF
jgi:hypothetical protein